MSLLGTIGIVFLVLVVIALLVAAGYFFYEKAQETSGPPPETNTVEARGFAFVPSTITVPKGTQVCWKNLASDTFLKHNVVQIDANACNASETVNGFTSGAADGKKDEYCYTFKDVGTFYYKCTPHCMLGMKGSVKVTE